MVAKYSAKKIEIYEMTGNSLALKESLEHHVFAFRQDNLVYAEKLKALQTADEWAAMRSRLLDSDSMQSQVYPLLAREGMYEQMMERVESHADIYALEQYESILKKNSLCGAGMYMSRIFSRQWAELLTAKPIGLSSRL